MNVKVDTEGTVIRNYKRTLNTALNIQSYKCPHVLANELVLVLGYIARYAELKKKDNFIREHPAVEVIMGHLDRLLTGHRRKHNVHELVEEELQQLIKGDH